MTDSYRLLLAVLFTLLPVMSCEKFEEVSVRETDTIVFTATLSSGSTPSVKGHSSLFTEETEDWLLSPDSKAPVTTTLDGRNAKVIGLLSGSGDIADVTPLDNFKNVIFSFNGDELTSESKIRWGSIPIRTGGVQMNNLKLYIYSPLPQDVAAAPGSDGRYKGIQFPSEDAAGAPIISYVLPHDKADHTDIIVANKEVRRTDDNTTSEFGKNIPLTFTHALSALRFKMGFDCIVKSVVISGVYNYGEYTIGAGWDGHEKVDSDGDGDADDTFILRFGENGEGVSVKAGDNLYDDVMMMIPQTIPFGETDDPRMTVTYEGDEGEKTISASLKGTTWREGRLITYTIHENLSTQDYIYFDLNAGSVTIQYKNSKATYSGKVFTIKDGKSTAVTVSGTHFPTNKYYVYQSTSSNRSATGWDGAIGTSNMRVPKYDPVYVVDAETGKRTLWSDFITNNPDVESVIEAWDSVEGAGQVTSTNKGTPSEIANNQNKPGATGAVRNVGRQVTLNNITVKGNVGAVNLNIDNLYSSYQEAYSTSRTTGGISFIPSGDNTVLTVNMIGDNRFGCIHYTNTDPAKHALVFEGTGSLTVADTDYYIFEDNGVKSYYSNRGCSVIGSSDNADHSHNIIFNSGVVFAGATKAEYCTAIGGGGNGNSTIEINGGVVTAVASGTGTAIGGGTGVSQAGGEGYVTINNGNVYAYNHANSRNIPSSAIGGAGSRSQQGSLGVVTINGGNVYAESGLGTAIGGGSSATKQGGDAEVYIYDGYVVAKSVSKRETGTASSGIGGGCSYTNKSSSSTLNGGIATIVIGKNGTNPIVRTGSIGGGTTGAGKGKIGSANITINSGDIQAQFVMAASDNNTFTMNGGTIRNSYHTDSEYDHIQTNGGAVYMEQGIFTLNGGTIKNCTGINGGAVYIKGSSGTKFIMNGGSIIESTAVNNGGALYLEGGSVTIDGGLIEKNLASKGNGGGICIKDGSFEMLNHDAIIRMNAAYSQNTPGCGSGGGVYVTSGTADVTVDIKAGTIAHNTSDRYGGGLGVYMADNSTKYARVNVGESKGNTNTDPNITENRASLEGGGLYIKGANSAVTINDGLIARNHIAGYADNSDVAVEGGMVTLNGGAVDSRTVIYSDNGEYYGGTDHILQQEVVTATNSLMNIPGEFTRLGYRLDSWHTRRDGDDTRGKRYGLEGIINISSKLTLYAQWIYVGN